MSTFRVFKRICWRQAGTKDYPWRGQRPTYEPAPKPIYECRTITTFSTMQEAIDFCTERNKKWMRYRETVQVGHASETRERVYYLSPRYEWTRVMTIHEGKFYVHEPEVWDFKKCQRVSKHIATDELGTPYPWPGYIGVHYKRTCYNGGIVIDDVWYAGDDYPFPEIDDAFIIVYVPTWGFKLEKIQ